MSDPVDLEVASIYPGNVVDENGKRYLVFSYGSFVPVADDDLSVARELKSSYRGGPIPKEWSIQCFASKARSWQNMGTISDPEIITPKISSHLINKVR